MIERVTFFLYTSSIILIQISHNTEKKVKNFYAVITLLFSMLFGNSAHSFNGSNDNDYRDFGTGCRRRSPCNGLAPWMGQRPLHDERLGQWP